MTSHNLIVHVCRGITLLPIEALGFKEKSSKSSSCTNGSPIVVKVIEGENVCTKVHNPNAKMRIHLDLRIHNTGVNLTGSHLSACVTKELEVKCDMTVKT